MIVEYCKENDMIYLSKFFNDRWVQIGLTRKEINQIAEVLWTTMEEENV